MKIILISETISMEISKIIILSSFVTTSLVSCPPPFPQHFYKPQPLDPVLLTHSNQMILNGSGYPGMFETSLSYSPTAKLGVRLGTGGGSYDYDKFSNTYLSAGYFKSLSNDFFVEAYGGFGMYYYNTIEDDPQYAPVRKINFNNCFIQPSLAFIETNFEAALTFRFDYLRRKKTDVVREYNPSEWKYAFLKHSDYFFLQPGITIKGGWKKKKFMLQVSKSIPFNKNYNSIYGPDDDAYISTGGATAQPDNKFHFAIGMTINLDLANHKNKK
jgi:hypothetical protein